MLYTKSNALQVAEATIRKVKEVSGPVAKPLLIHVSKWFQDVKDL